MTKKVVVIPSTKDGAELREAQRNKYHIRCDGKADEQEINEALQSSMKSQWSGLGNAWNRIFRRK